jgi:hypothetical protein
MMAASALMKGAANYQSAKAAQRQYEEEEKTMLLNAEMSAGQTAYNEDVMRRMQRNTLSQISGAMSENGLGGSEMALLSYGQSALNSEYDIRTERDKGIIQTFNFRRRAAAAKANARSARNAANMGLMGGMLDFGAGMASMGK